MPPPGSEVEHDVALVQLGHRGRIATTEARKGGRVGKVTALVARVQRLAERAWAGRCHSTSRCRSLPPIPA